MSEFYIWDLETYPNCFLFSGKFEGSAEVQTFEISDRKNEKDKILTWLSYFQNSNVKMIGYNSLGFDYPIIHDFLTNHHMFTALHAHLLGSKIIESGDYGFEAVRFNDRFIPQIDLAKINHFDNKNRRTSLKSLQFAMRAESVEDLPFEIRNLTSEEIDTLIEYNKHDVLETERFFKKCKHLIDMRQELLTNGVLTGDVLNYSDVKIGTEYLIKQLGRKTCYLNGSKPKQTMRTEIAFNEVILPKIKFYSDEFDKVLTWFKQQKIFITSEERPKLEAPLAGLQFHFGVGGVHASVENKYYKSNETHVIKDIDVSGMYVAVAISNGFYPEHLGQAFVDAYRGLQRDRAQYKKGTAMNATLKLAGNGAYGNSNNPYSPFYDPKYTFSVTVNGQLQLLQLAEALTLIPGLQIIQANTDGITAYVPRDLEQFFNMWKTDWEVNTGLKLEEVEYSDMWIRDVNNYLAVTTEGKVKRKGAYQFPETDKDYDGYWNKDYSMMVVQKSIELVLRNKWRPEDVVRLNSDPFDFMLRYKTPGGAKVYIGDKLAPKTVRYYVSTKGEPMKKIALPKGKIGDYKRRAKITDSYYESIAKDLPAGAWDERIHTKNKSKYEIVETSIESGRLVKECNVASKFDWRDVDFDYYAQEIKKLIVGENHE